MFVKGDVLQKQGGIVCEKRRNRENILFFRRYADDRRKRAVSVEAATDYVMYYFSGGEKDG